MKEPYVPMKLNLLSFTVPGMCGAYTGEGLEGVPNPFVDSVLACVTKIKLEAAEGFGVNLQNS